MSFRIRSIAVIHTLKLCISNTAGVLAVIMTLVVSPSSILAATEMPMDAAEATKFARLLFAQCTAVIVNNKMDCYHRELDEHVTHVGAGSALDVLIELTKLDLQIGPSTHMLVHWVGWAAYTRYGNPSDAFLNCKDTFGSGCYHGVLQKHMEYVGNVTEDDVRDMCYKTIDTKSSVFLRYQCLHGEGHGLMLHFNRDVEKSLKYCDALQTDWDRESCYGGVFMENYGPTHAGHDEGHGHGSEHADHVEKPRVTGLRTDDLHYPCSAIDEKYKRTCYFLQSSAMFTLVGQDYEKVFRACDQAPKQHIEMCYRSLGRDISGYTFNDPKKVAELCLLGNDDYVRFCYIGAVQDFINNTAKPDSGIRLCSTLVKDYKRDCYGGVGEMLQALYPNKTQREAACEKVEARFIPFCKTKAGLY